MLKEIDDIKRKLYKINSYNKKINIMEVCGTHTVEISRLGLREALNDNVNLISGPGCPVCVTHNSYLDYIYELSLEKKIIIATYGDMIRVPGTKPNNTLENAKAQGAEVKIVYSSIDALKIAESNRDKKVVFLGIGFETTAPHTAVAVKEALKCNIDNFYVLSLHKKVEPVMLSLLMDKTLEINGFLCPGHVAAIIGEEGFSFLNNFNCSSVIAGFELEQLVKGIELITENYFDKNYCVSNIYEKIVRKEGNLEAIKIINDVFEVSDDYWRGMGLIKNSGYKLKEEYNKLDILNYYKMEMKENYKDNGCQCGEVLKGKIKPNMCKLFRKICTPDNPVGPCMVSNEGSCAAYYRYNL